MDEVENDESEDHIWRALAAIKELAAAQRNDGGADAALAAIREKLFQIRASENVPNSALGKIWSGIRRISGQNERVEAVIVWLVSTGRFDIKQINRIRRVGLFFEQENGLVCVRDQPISAEWAAIISAVISMMVGAWVSWVWFAADGNSQILSASLVLGNLFGRVEGTIIDKSFRFATIRQDVLEVAPWLGTGVSVSCAR